MPRKRARRPKKPSNPPYRGVEQRGKYFRAHFRFNCHLYNLGTFTDAAEAAWAADFAQYMLFGLDPAAWPNSVCRRYHGGGKRLGPNFPPRGNWLGAQNHVLRILFAHRLLDLATMERRRKEYDAATARPAPAIS
jgi:hypothetical protein